MKLGEIKNLTTFRILFTGFLVLLLLVPMGMIESVITERGHLYRQANEEITASWGSGLLLTGPVLSLPYVETVGGGIGRSYETRYKHLRPGAMVINASIDIEVRHRGIYKVPVYSADVLMHGRFMLAEVLATAEDTALFALEQGLVQIPVSNGRALKEPVQFSWDGAEVALRAHRDGSAEEAVIFNAELPAASLDRDTVHTFELRLMLAGSSELAFVSSSQAMAINIDANWAAPGFFGVHLPASYTIGDDVFTAAWEVNDFFTDPGHADSECIAFHWIAGQPRFGVRLVQSVDTYQLVTRAAKYAVLFIGLTFLVYFFTEWFGKVALHPVQYLFVGMANCIFYLLLLSLAEHIRFGMAYLISASAATVLISLYSLSILKGRARAALVWVTLAGLYAYLYVTLQSEDYALLIGSIGLFVILGLIMYTTRNIDWRRTPEVNSEG